MSRLSLLTINSGSSSVKFALYQSEDLLASGKLDGTRLRAHDSSGNVLVDEPLSLQNREAAIQHLLRWLDKSGYLQGIGGVGYRIVHGGSKYVEAVIINPDVLNELRTLIPLAPDHLPDQIATLEQVSNLLPQIAAVACFDTSFHRTMPRHAQLFGLPPDVIGAGVERYGFHGLSYSYIVDELRKEGNLPERLIVAHLGNGASMAAILNGRSIDTSMGLTPTGGFIMSDRSGDLDPGVLLFLLRNKKMSVDQLADLVNQGSGLKGLSGISGDMQVLEKESPDTVYLFCYQVKKYLGAYMAALGGLDMLVFTGGIGENSSKVREWICADLERLGIVLEAGSTAGVISAKKSAVEVRVMKTNEELVIARTTANLLTARAKSHQ